LPPARRLIVATLIVTSVAALALQGAGAGPPRPPLRDGLPYTEARSLLIAAGWRPARLQPQPDCQSNAPDRRCRLFVELRSCSHTGAGLCRFEWRSPQGRLYAVITRNGDPDGRPGLVNTWFRVE
jgi:hypothetical protein